VSGAKRVVVLVIDALGVGAMDDLDELTAADADADTLGHVLGAAGAISLPHLGELGLRRLTAHPALGQGPVTGAHGTSRLAHPGADSYLGHQELMGTIPRDVELQLMTTVREDVRQALLSAGHRVADFGPSMLLVDGEAVVADNMENAPGVNINVTCAHDRLPEEQILEIGRAVRGAVKVGRVIVVMGKGFTSADVVENLLERRGAIGPDSAALGVYDEHYRVRHLGAPTPVDGQLPTIAKRAGLDVHLLGKAADIVECEDAHRSRDIPTDDVMTRVCEALDATTAGLVVANVQEGDLAGHGQDAQRWADVLSAVDRRLPEVLARLGDGDLLIVSGDHGNDPLIGHNNHTRELTALLAYGVGTHAAALGTRSTLADVAASACDWLELDAPADGTSFRAELAAQAVA
jgi:phosphopentomutase